MKSHLTNYKQTGNIFTNFTNIGHDIFVNCRLRLCPIYGNFIAPEMNAVGNQFAACFRSCTMIDILDKGKATVPSLVRYGATNKNNTKTCNVHYRIAFDYRP